MDKKKIQHILPLAHDMFDKGQLSDALEVLNSLELVDSNTERQKLIFYTLMSKIHVILLNYSEAYDMADKGMIYAQNLEKDIEIVDFFICRAFILNFYRKTQESMNLLEESSTILNNLPHISDTVLQQRMGLIYLNRGHNYKSGGDDMNCLEMYKKSMDLLEQCGPPYNLARAYAFYAKQVKFLGDFNEALHNFAKSQKICENQESPQYNVPKLLSFMGKSVIFLHQGEIQLALETSKKAVSLARAFNNSKLLVAGLNVLGGIYLELGDKDQTIKNLEEALSLSEKSENPTHFMDISNSVFGVYLNWGEITAAQQLFHKMEQFQAQKKDNEYIALVYRYSKALLLRKSSRTRDLGVAQEIFHQIIDEKVYSAEVTHLAILNLCEMLLDEFKDTQNVEVLEEFSSLNQRLLAAAKYQHSYSKLAKTHLLDAKLHILKFDFNKARHSLTKAQHIAEQYGLKRLTLKISNEHDNLLHHLEMWEQMKQDNVPMSKRLEKIDLYDQILTMLKKKPEEKLETSPESPIMLLIMAKSGLPLYAKIFSKELKFSEGLFSSFLSAFNSFSNEIFSEGLDRANFGNYTILMTGLPPFKSCYVFEGQSFLAQQKFAQFNVNLHDSQQIWQNLTSADKKGQKLRDAANFGLEHLVNTVFINKKKVKNIKKVNLN